jgi:hypothetical protein
MGECRCANCRYAYEERSYLTDEHISFSWPLINATKYHIPNLRNLITYLQIVKVTLKKLLELGMYSQKLFKYILTKVLNTIRYEF